MILSLSSLLFTGYLYLIIPFIIFLLGWVKLVISIPISLIIIYIVYLLYKDSKQNYQETFTITKSTFWSIVVIFTLLLFVLGVVGIFPHSWDMIGRNTMFRDLITYEWPVIYQKNGAVVYYIGYWLVPALIGKIAGYTIGQIALLLWGALGLVLTALLLILYLRPSKSIYIHLIIGLFITFSPILSSNGFPFLPSWTIEYSSNIVQLVDLQNQSIAMWLMVILFMHQKNTRNFAFLGLSVTLASPYTIIGMFPFMLLEVYKQIKNKDFLYNIFTPVNILSSLAIAPILYLYLSANSTATSNAFMFLLPLLPLTGLLLTYSQAFGIYMILIFSFYKKNPYYWVTLFTLIGLSWIKYSGDHNFSRASNPALFILMILILKYMIDESFFRKINMSKYILYFCLSIGCAFFVQRTSSNIIGIINKGPIPMEFRDYTDTQHNNQWSNIDYKNTTFFKYLAKRNTP